MNRWRTTLWVVALTIGLSLGGTALGVFAFAQPKDPDAVQKIMRAKLEHSQEILEGVATEDFDAIKKNAQSLALLSQAAGWQVYQTPDYQQYSADFRRIADSLVEKAEKKNLDGAALDYMRLTMSCVQCHKYIRGVRITKAEPELIPIEPMSIGRAQRK